MDASSLARDLDNLEKSWSSLDWWLNAWSILVVLGVAVELLVIITEYALDWRDFKRGTIHTPDKPSILIFGLGFLGAALVAVGVAGEFRIHVKGGKIEGEMRDKTRQLVAIAEGEASKANQRAAKANERAADANLRASQLVARMAPLHITKEQQTKLSDRLANIPGLVVNLIASPGPHILPDPRSGERIWLSFARSDVKEAGWDIRLLITENKIPPGVVVRVRRGSDRSISRRADRVVEALISCGIDAATRGADFDPTETPSTSGYMTGSPRQWADDAKMWISAGN